MAYAPDRVPDRHAYDPAPTTYPSTPPTYTNAPYDDRPRHYSGDRARDAGREVRHEMTREVTAGPFQYGVREGILGIFAILGLALGLLGFAAAFALDGAAEALNDGATTTGETVAAGTALLPALLVSLLPFMASVVLSIGCGAWAGHASRNSTIGAIAGGVGTFLGPILMLLITGIGFALGAGATGLDLSNVDRLAGDWGMAPGWANTIPYLFTGAGLLWLFANLLAGALTGALVGGLLDHDRRAARHEARRERYSRRVTRY